MGGLNLKYLFLCSAALLLLSWYMYSDTYKRVGPLLPATHAAPLQGPLTGAAAAPGCCKGPYCWQFSPLYEYSVTGMAFGISHKLSSEFDDVMAADVGLLWGENAAKELYRDVKLRVMMDHYEVWWKDGQRFNLADAANTHLVSCDDGAFAAAKRIRPGDQVRIRGWLVNARAFKEPGETDPRKILSWHSSVTREDRGEGACELLYVRSAGDIEILERGPRFWSLARWPGAAGMLLAVFLWHRRLKAHLAAVRKADF
ncbi:MAG: hypothetical protein CVU79_07365 [Elusimicrobia bacterium HGW-Elusimicrobia-3]|nr:MAG: hypothetical protein CVU79_07365 [Elusimicrobia bacterium HGW-Elusimicrobia-3]